MNLEYDAMAKRVAALERLLQVSIQLTTETKLSNLLKTVVHEGRVLLEADGATLYLVEPDGLRFHVSENETLKKQLGAKEWRRLSAPYVVPMTSESMVGHVALTGECMNVENVYSMPEDNAHLVAGAQAFDKLTGYTTQSLLTVPLQVAEGAVVGVLQLINSQNGSFSAADEPVAQGLAATASAAITKAMLTEQIKDARQETIIRLARAAEFRDKETSAHIQRMSHISAILARRMGLSEKFCEDLLVAAPMHDVGKIGIPDSILQKPGKLNAEEWEIMKTHAAIGGRILAGSNDPILQLSAEVALAHHEKWDGSGYPEGLSGENIPLSGRIVALADVFDALCSKRCYKEAMTLDQVTSIIQAGRGAHFQPEVVDRLFDDLDEILELYELFKNDDPDEFKILTDLAMRRATHAR
jgi:HD-GYP domain-containing protein (c-di-GMP phosphodiesterase class II)